MTVCKPPSVFETERPRLLGLAYRILGSRADAEDAVQDTYLKWAEADQASIESPGAWLTTVCTRRCLDLLRAGHRARVSYVGAWLPEPIHTATEQDQDSSLELASSLSTAFLLILERLTPKERAAYLLYEIFETPYPEIARSLSISEAACRKLVSRARGQVGTAEVRYRTPPARQEALLAAFQSAITAGVSTPLEALLSEDVRLTADSGGKVPALRDPIAGKAKVLDFLSGKLRHFWAGHRRQSMRINGDLGLLVDLQDETRAAVTFSFDEAGLVTDVFIVRNPDKLLDLGAVAIL